MFFKLDRGLSDWNMLYNVAHVLVFGTVEHTVTGSLGIKRFRFLLLQRI